MRTPADVGVVIPARGAAADLAPAVASALAEDVGVVVVAVDPADGPTAAEAHRLAGADRRVRVVANPGGRTSVGLTTAVAATTTPVVARLDAHARFEPGYVRRALAVLDGADVAVVGGRQHAVGDHPVARAVAAAQGSRLGSGGARHRVGGPAGPAETAYLGVFERAWLERVGGFDPALDRNQDYEVCHRIIQAGGVVWFDPSMVARYRPRGSLAALAVQYHSYGRWKRRVMADAPGSIRPRQLAAPVLVAVLAWSAARRDPAAPVAYAALLAAAAATAEATEPPPLRPAERLLVALSTAVMHLSWGAGFWRGGRGREAVRRGLGRSGSPRGRRVWSSP